MSFTLLQEQLHSVLGTLSEREAGVVSMRSGADRRPAPDPGRDRQGYRATRQRIRQIKSKAMSKQRQPSRSNILRNYLD